MATSNISKTPASLSRAPAQASPAVVSALDSELIEISGVVKRIVFANAETGYYMLNVESGKDRFTVKGLASFVPAVGKPIRAMAEKEVHPRYGIQYEAKVIHEDIPKDPNGMVAYLTTTVSGIGKVLAAKIVAHFGQDTYDVIGTAPERLKEVGGIAESKIQAIKESWLENNLIRSLWTILAPYGLPGFVPAALVNEFGADAIDAVRRNPYEISRRIDGIGFKRADAIAMAVGIELDSPKRIGGAIESCLKDAHGNGDTSIVVAKLIGEVVKLTALWAKVDKIKDVVENMKTSRRLVERELDGHPCLSLAQHASHEKAISSRIVELMLASNPNEELSALAATSAQALNDNDQASAVRNVFLSGVSVVTGRPGCGKTTTTKVIATVAEEAGLKVAMCAPTGKAARRITEATGFPANTIHSTVGWRVGQGGQGASGDEGVLHDRHNPVKADLFILDEASMSDTQATKALLEAIPDGARLVIIGDADQLPSVGPGNCLRDIISSGMVPVTILKTVHRNALDSDIIPNAHRIINGEIKSVDLAGSKDFKFTSAIEDDETVSAVVAAYRDLIKKHGRDNVQVLAARYATEVGVRKFNEILSRVANPVTADRPVLQHAGRSFYVGDRVIRMATDRKAGVSNGEVGVVTHIDPENKTARINFGTRDVLHVKKDMGKVELAYCITTHKSQGSEFPGVIVVMPRAHKFMLNRNLFYTAVTRGKRDVHVVGAEDCVRGSIAKIGSNRVTGLKAELVAAFVAAGMEVAAWGAPPEMAEVEAGAAPVRSAVKP